MKKILIALLPLLLLSLLFTGCNRSDLDPNGNPKTFIVGVANPQTSTEDIEQRFRSMEPFRKYLEKKLGVPVVFISTNSYAAVVEAFKSKKLHLASISPYPYLIARKKSNVEALIAMGAINGSHSIYYSCILSKKSSGIKTIGDIKANASKLTIAFGDPASTSGHIVPKRFLIDHGINPEKDFKNAVFSANSLELVNSLMSGKYDLSCTTMQLFDSPIIKGKISKDSVNIISISQSIPQAPYAIRSDINPQFKKKVQDAYINAWKDKTAWKCMLDAYSRYIKISPDSLRFIPAQEKWYNDFETMIKDIHGLELPQ